MAEQTFQIIAHIQNGFTEKFGIPRQSGIVNDIPSRIVFEPQYRNPDAFRGLEGYSHLWLLWQFSESIREKWSPTVRPPKLGGNKRMGVFATRSPFRPNPIGLSCVRLIAVDLYAAEGPVLHVSGADLMDGTPIYDIKPYLAYTDAHPEAKGGFSKAGGSKSLFVEIPTELEEKIPPSLRAPLSALLAEDPRPGYQDDPDRVYKMAFNGMEVHFQVKEDTVTVRDIFIK